MSTPTPDHTAQSETVIRVRDLAKTFHIGFWRKKVEAVKGVDFDVYDGEIFGLVGPNGAGKTTTMKMLTSLIFPDAGRVELFGRPASDTEGRRQLGYLPEAPYFYEHLTAAELLRYYGSLHGLDRDTISGRIDRLLELVGLEEARDRPLRKFSKGMRQRAGIAQALINDPELVILDEPQSGLDPVGRKEVRDLIYRLREEGKTVLFSSHILVDVEAVCDRVAIMNEGELVEIARMDELADSEGQQVEIVVHDFPAHAEEIAENLPGLRGRESTGAATVLTFEGDIDVNATLRRLSDAGATIRTVDRHGRRLEDQFIRDTQSREAR